MSDHLSRKTGADAQMWAVALCVSVLLNGALISWVSISAIKSENLRKNSLPAPPPPPEQTVKIFPEMFEQKPPSEAAKKAAEDAASVVRTSPQQESAEPPASRRFLGERNTRATSDRAPTADDASMPSQAGREPRPGEFETTESDYQDGKTDAADKPSPAVPPANPVPPSPEQAPQEMAKGDRTLEKGDDDDTQTALREKLLDGPNPVPTPVAKAEVNENEAPRPEKKVQEGMKDSLVETEIEQKPEIASEQKPKPAAIDDPAFRGNQSKTAIVGSISRHGETALDVTDSAMGRYQSAVGRAVEKQWLRACVQRRDFIVPGYLTVRFFVQPDGRVKSVQFVGDIEGGEVQKGFTLQSIREAAIPPMPPGVKSDLGGDSLELLFNFYF